MGASKKAKVHSILFPSQKRAYDAARNAGQGKPILHPPHKRGERRHIHPTDKNGEIIKDGKIGGIHYEFGKIYYLWNGDDPERKQKEREEREQKELESKCEKCKMEAESK